MKELLKLVGYEPEEMESELPRVEKAFKKMGLNSEDIERGKQRLNKYYDTELKGVRKTLGCNFREVIDTVLTKEEGKTKFIAGFMCPGAETIGSVIACKSKDVYMVHLPWAFEIIIGCVFDKMVPVLEAAEKKWLKSGVVAHCGNVKIFLGLIALGLIPTPDLLMSSGLLCETAPKTLDLLREINGIPVSCYDICPDREIGEYSEGLTRNNELGRKSLRKLTEKVEDIAGFKITDEMIFEILDAKMKIYNAINELRNITGNSDPLVLSATHDILWSYFGSLTLDKDGMSKQLDAINTLCEELRERVEKGQGVLEKGAPRIMAINPPGHSDPRLDYLVGEVGIALVSEDSDFLVDYMPEDMDPYKMMFGYARASLASICAARIPLIVDGCKKSKVEGVLNRFHVGCRSVSGDALMIEKAVKEELGIPVLTLEWENFDPRIHNHEQFKQRLEVFKAMMT